MVGSVDDWDLAAAIVGRAEQVFGGLDGLVNNAAIMPVGLAWDMGRREIDRAVDVDVDVDVKRVVYCGTHALRSMARRGRGAIVNVISGRCSASTSSPSTAR